LAAISPFSAPAQVPRTLVERKTGEAINAKLGLVVCRKFIYNQQV